MKIENELNIRKKTQPKGTVEKVLLGVQKLVLWIPLCGSFAIFKALKFIEFTQPMLSLKPHQQAGALRFWVFQHALKVAATFEPWVTCVYKELSKPKNILNSY